MIKERKIGLEDPERSGLFYECNRVLKEVNPKYFLMENVVMKPEDEAVISEMMGVKPIRINSSLVVGQLRDRYYWTNIPGVTVPEDKGVTLQSVLNDGYVPNEKAKCLCKNDSHGYYNGCFWTPIKRFHRFYYKSFGTMVFPSKEYFDNCLEVTKRILDGRKSSAKSMMIIMGMILMKQDICGKMKEQDYKVCQKNMSKIYLKKMLLMYLEMVGLYL